MKLRPIQFSALRRKQLGFIGAGKGGFVGGYQVQRSVRLRSAASAYFRRDFTGAGNQQKWTLSFWVKQGNFSNSPIAFHGGPTGARPSAQLAFFNSVNRGINFQQYNGSGYDFQLETTAVYRDPAAPMHVELAFDSTQATASNRVKLYVNGVQVAFDYGTPVWPSLNFSGVINSGATHGIGAGLYGSVNSNLDGYLSEVNFIDGQALTPAAFGETDAATNQWVPKKYTGTYGTNGFYLDFSDITSTTTIGYDKSGNGNNWTANNISLTAGATYDSMLDVPGLPWADGGNGRGNYATLNPLGYKPANTTISQANLRVTSNTSSCFGGSGTIAVSSGKWYWEATFAGAQYMIVGIDSATTPISTDTYVGATSTSYGYYSGNGNKINNNAGSVYGASYTTNDVIGVALDMDAGTLVFYKNGTSQGTAFSGLSGSFVPSFSDVDIPSGGCDIAVNFGQRPFAYTPPTGFKALHTGNLAAPTIRKPSDHFNIALDTGANIKATTEALYPANFFEWIKDRANVNNHQLIDTVRGTSAVLQSNTTAAETTYSAPAGSSVGWAWKAGGAPVSNTAGSITSQVSANVEAGFSIVKWIGAGTINATVGHGLGRAPKLRITKNLSTGSTGWPVHTTVIDGSLDFLFLNTTAAKGDSGENTDTSTVFSVHNTTDYGANGQNYITYCFAEIPGYSKFGSYTGNGSSDGPFVYCGFRPRWVMVKRTDASTHDWVIWDTARNTYNVLNNYLLANTSGAEGSTSVVDALSNGFKLRETGSGVNASGGTYIFAAFAESPFPYANAR